MLTKNGNVRGCKKPNGNTLESTPVSVLAGNGDKLPETNYCTVTIKNKQGVMEC